MKKVLVLGGGLVGSVIAKDLLREDGLEVAVSDNNRERLDKIEKTSGLKCILSDLSKEGALKEIPDGFDMVIGAVPGYLGFKVVKEAIDIGKNVVDISFSERDYMELDSIAKEKNATAIFDCGVAPGMSNILAKSLSKELDSTESIRIYVGGLPQVRYWPYEYKIVFSPYDVIEEYTRPARVVEKGQIITKEALSDVEKIDIQGVGTLEAFNTDGLRSLLYTMNVPDMAEKTLRFPGHVEKMKILRYTGFFGKEPIDVKGTIIRPLDLTAKLLFPLLELKEDERDFTVMRIEAKGKKEGRNLILSYSLIDYFDAETKATSMARTTGFPAAIIARMILNGELKRTGVFPPEAISEDDALFKNLLFQLESRGVRFVKEQKEVI